MSNCSKKDIESIKIISNNGYANEIFDSIFMILHNKYKLANIIEVDLDCIKVIINNMFSLYKQECYETKMSLELNYMKYILLHNPGDRPKINYKYTNKFYKKYNYSDIYPREKDNTIYIEIPSPILNINL